MSTESQLQNQTVATSPPSRTRLGILEPLKISRNFTALWLGQSTSRFGDVLLNVILPLTVYSMTGSPLKMGTVMMLVTLPVLLLPLTGLLADRMPRIPLMIGSDLVRLVLMILLTVLAATHSLTMPWLYVFAVIMGTMNAIFQPAYAAVRAQVFTPDIRNAANSLTQVSGQTSALVGPSIGGLLMSVSTATLGFAVNGLTYIVSIISLLFLKVAPPQKQERQEQSWRSFADDLLVGYRELKKDGWLWMTILCFGVVNIASGGITEVLLPWLVKMHLQLPSYAFGLLTSASGLGALIAAFLFGQRKTWRRRGILAYVGTAMSGLMLFGMAFVNWLPLLVVFSFFSGAGIMIFGIIWEVSLQEMIPEEAYGRVVSLDMLGSFILLPVGYLLTGWLAEHIGGLFTMTMEGAVVAGLALLMLLLKPIRRYD